MILGSKKKVEEIKTKVGEEEVNEEAKIVNEIINQCNNESSDKEKMMKEILDLQSKINMLMSSINKW